MDVTNLESGVAGRLLGQLKWNSAGDVAARLALFDRDVSRYEMRSGEGLAANMKVGIVVRQFDEIALKTRFGGEHFAVTDWNVVKNVVHDIRGAQAAVQCRWKLERSAKSGWDGKGKHTVNSKKSIP